MMKVYAVVLDGVVSEIIIPHDDLEGNQYPIDVCFSSDVVKSCVDITDVDPMPDQRWTYEDGKFCPEVQVVFDVVAHNEAQKLALSSEASQAMTPLLLALQLGDATDSEKAKAIEWRDYSRALQLVDVTEEDIVWPIPPQ